MHVPIPAFIMETIWSIVCRIRGVSAATNPPTLRSFLLLMRYHSISRTLFPVSSLSLYLVPPVFALRVSSILSCSCSCSRTLPSVALCGDTRATKLLIARLRCANAKDFRLHAWRATKGATRKSLVVIRTRALAGGTGPCRAYRAPRLNHYIERKRGETKFHPLKHQTFDKNRQEKWRLFLEIHVL